MSVPVARSDPALLKEGYETLRQGMLGERPSGRSWGLMVLMREGLAAWMESWSDLARQPAPTISQRQCLPEALHEEVVHVLASMAFNQLREVLA